MLVYAVLKTILFPYVGGDNPLFHKAFISGFLQDVDGEPILKVESLVIEEERQNKHGVFVDTLIPVDISPPAIDKGRLRNPHLFSDNPSRDWLDYM